MPFKEGTLSSSVVILNRIRALDLYQEGLFKSTRLGGPVAQAAAYHCTPKWAQFATKFPIAADETGEGTSRLFATSNSIQGQYAYSTNTA